ncbi:hypothetical protein IFM89_005022 [Coptis chinensis]|uniref:Uncharacterized protein n=1 Tax=Coptis chinensis TaxID=261450 RepID=A0A835HLH3_9MAGN|nr:hypothetical protein IFM89_005022 [Coptis chinensis]
MFSLSLFLQLQASRSGASSLKYQTKSFISHRKNFASKVLCCRTRPLSLSSSLSKQAKGRLICSVTTQPQLAEVEENKMDTPKEIFLKDYKMPDYYFDKGRAQICH